MAQDSQARETGGTGLIVGLVALALVVVVAGFMYFNGGTPTSTTVINPNPPSTNTTVINPPAPAPAAPTVNILPGNSGTSSDAGSAGTSGSTSSSSDAGTTKSP